MYLSNMTITVKSIYGVSNGISEKGSEEPVGTGKPGGVPRSKISRLKGGRLGYATLGEAEDEGRAVVEGRGATRGAGWMRGK